MNDRPTIRSLPVKSAHTARRICPRPVVRLGPKDRQRRACGLAGTLVWSSKISPLSLAQQKPFRDWLTEILACALGYYTWEFGKLKLGARINASAVEAFTIGNILFQSLRLEPVEATFEHLIIDFADQNYQYQANTRLVYRYRGQDGHAEVRGTGRRVAFHRLADCMPLSH